VFQEERGRSSRKEALQAVTDWSVGATMR